MFYKFIYKDNRNRALGPIWGGPDFRPPKWYAALFHFLRRFTLIDIQKFIYHSKAGFLLYTME